MFSRASQHFLSDSVKSIDFVIQRSKWILLLLPQSFQCFFVLFLLQLLTTILLVRTEKVDDTEPSKSDVFFGFLKEAIEFPDNLLSVLRLVSEQRMMRTTLSPCLQA
jgi:hypothetical protein